MKAIEIPVFGAADVLSLTERPQPEPQEGEVLIHVQAAGINRPDLLQRQGHYPPPSGVTDIPGLEVAGIVAKSYSPLWKEGDKVCTLLAGGGYAEYVAVPAGQCLPVPENLSMAEAAALPETVFTVWNNVFERGALQKGEVLLVHGGASGIGTTAIQMAKAHGAKVIITAGSDEKCKACLKLGADIAINYKTQDFAKELANQPVDVVLDMVGGDYVAKNLSLLAENGRHISIAFLHGAKAEIDIRTVMQKRLSLSGSTLRPRPAKEKEALCRSIREHIWPHVEKGTIKPVIFRTFPFTEAVKAHETLEKGDHIGKIVLQMS